MKIYILCSNREDGMYKYIPYDFCRTFYKQNIWKNNLKRKAFRLFSVVNSFFGFDSLYFGSWKKELTNSFFIVLDPVGLHLDVMEFINAHPDHFCIYLENVITNKKILNRIKRAKCKVISFDPEQAKELEIPQFHFMLPKIPQSSIIPEEYDFAFIGRDKGRKKFIEMMEKGMPDKRFYKYIISDIISDTSKAVLSYEEYLSIISKSRCLIELIQEGQTGTTLRLIESLYYQKKLLTTARYVSTLPFYNSNNIYILKDLNNINFQEIKSFLDTPYIPINPSLFCDFSPLVWSKKIFEIATTQTKK